MISICILIAFLVIVGLFVWAARSPTTRLQFIDEAHRLHTMFSVRWSMFTGTLAALIPIMEQLQAIAPQLAAVEQLHQITEANWYKTLVAVSIFFTIVARGVRLPPKQ